MYSNSTFGKLVQFGYQQITPVTLTGLLVPIGAKILFMKCEVQNVRWRDDGANPTATVGMIMLPTDDLFLYTGNMGKLIFLEAAGGGIVNISYYG